MVRTLDLHSYSPGSIPGSVKQKKNKSKTNKLFTNYK